MPRSKKIKTFHSYSTGSASLDTQIDHLLKSAEIHTAPDLIKELMVTALKLGHDEINRGDLKLMSISLKELRYALNVFHPFQSIRKVAIFGSARTPRNAKSYTQARDFAKEITEEGWMVITGAASGIMNAGNEGAGRHQSFGVNIRLPFEQEANPIIANDPKLINFKYFFTRKLIFMRESDATVLFPGGFGTHDEGFESLTLVQTGKMPPRPIVCLDPPGSAYWKDMISFLRKRLSQAGYVDPEDIQLIYHTHSISEAIRYITNFYRNYHSIRYIQDMLVIRMKQPLPKLYVSRIHEKYKGILAKGKIRQTLKPFKEEANEPRLKGMARLSLYFNRRHFARLHALIRDINKL